MNKNIEVAARLRAFKGKGGQQSHSNRVAHVEQLREFARVEFCQIGKNHVWAWYDEQPRGKPLSKPTLRDRYYAACLLWEYLGRPGKPPYPKQLEDTPKINSELCVTCH